MRSVRTLAQSLVLALLVAGGLVATGVATRPAEAAISQQVLFTRDTHGYGCYRIPALVRTNAGTLLAFAEARVSYCGDAGHIDLVMRRSTDNGRTWQPPLDQPPQIVLQGTDSDPGAAATRGNPAPVVDRRTGRILLLSTFNPADTDRPRTPYLQHSDDDGRTWSTARSLAAEIDEPDWGWYATGPSHGIQLTRGPNAGRLVAGVNFSDGAGRNGASIVYSDDGGDTWTRGATDIRTSTDIVPQELSLFERTDGGVYAAARDNNGTADGDRAYAVSQDGGASFEAPFAIVPELVTPVVQGSTLRLRAADEGDRYNRVLFASPAHDTLRKDMTIWSSYDEGRTWTTAAPKQITADRSGYSDMTELATGEIGLLYESGAYPDGDARDEIRFAWFTESDLGMPDNYSGIVTPDLSGAGNDSYLRGGATLTTGRFDEAVDLDGTDDYVHLPFAESLALDAGDFTAMAWIRYGVSTANQAIFWGYGQNDAAQFWLRAEPGSSRIRGLINTGSAVASVSSGKAYNDGAWHHVALQLAGGQLRLWVDGAVVATASAPTGSISPNRPFRMYAGQRLDGAHRFHGQLDEVRLYKRALSSTEIGAIRSSNAVTASGAVLRLPFTTDGPTTPDVSGAGNIGFVRGGAGLTTGRYGGGLAFDGADDAVHLPFTDSLDLGAGEFTVTAWLRYGGGTTRHAILWGYDQGSATAQLWLRAHPGDNLVRGWAETGSSAAWVDSTSAYKDNAWHHVVLQRTGTQLLLYVDGVEVAATAAPTGSVTAGHTTAIRGLYLGQRLDGADRLKGTLDDVRVFRRALTPTELDLIRLGDTSIGEDLVLHLPLDRIDP